MCSKLSVRWRFLVRRLPRQFRDRRLVPCGQRAMLWDRFVLCCNCASVLWGTTTVADCLRHLLLASCAREDQRNRKLPPPSELASHAPVSRSRRTPRIATGTSLWQRLRHSNLATHNRHAPALHFARLPLYSLSYQCPLLPARFSIEPHPAPNTSQYTPSVASPFSR